MPKLPILPQAKYVKNGEYESAYFTLGEKGNEPLLLCHGLAANGLQFVKDAEFFAAKGYYVIVPDLRGLGRSKMPVNPKESDFAVFELASDLIKILEKEEIGEINWVGNSLGGILALFIMGSSPKRLKSFISFGTAYSLDVPEGFLPIYSFLLEKSGKDLIAKIGTFFTSSNPDAKAIIYQMLKDADMFVVASIAAYVRSYDFIPNALSFERPMLFIRCSSDFAVNSALGPTLKAMQNRSNFTLIDIKGAGHVANLDRPKEVRQAILDFLANNR